jgi:hypothetical protein
MYITEMYKTDSFVTEIPSKAFGTFVGYINGVDLTDSTINAVMIPTEDGQSIKVDATITDLPPLTGI